MLPLGHIAVTTFQSFGNGRLIAHSLFNLIFLVIFVAFRSELSQRLKGNAMILPLGSILHLVEDRMWKEPAILFYPFMGSIPLKPPLSLFERIQRIMNAYRDAYILTSESICLLFMCFLYAFYRNL